MQVGFYTPNYPGLTGDGGIGSYVRAVGHGLVALGHEVVVLAAGDRPSTTDGPIQVEFVSSRHLPFADKVIPGAGACWRVFRTVRRLAREHRLDVFEFPNWEGYGVLVPHLTRLPTVARLYTSSAEAQTIDGQKLGRWHRWNVRRERWQALTADRIVTHSDVHRRMMATEYACPVERIDLIPLGITTFPAFVRPPRPLGPLTVVYLGRLEHRKGTVELLQAIPQVLAAVPNARFILIGADRPHAPGNRTHTAYLEQDFPPAVQGRVTLTGPLPQPDVDRWLQTADLFVAPSRYESFGLIFLEAMRWGTPVLGTTAGGIPEVVEHRRSGWLVPPENAAELAAGIVLLLRDDGLRTALALAGRARVEAEFTVERMARRQAALYEDVIATRRRRL